MVEYLRILETNNFPNKTITFVIYIPAEDEMQFLWNRKSQHNESGVL